jgi:thiol-disulfide isomerase/thioredoxin
MYAKFNTIGKDNDDNVNTSSVLAITTKEQRSSIIKSHTLVVIKHYTTWCGPCKQTDPKYAELTTKYNSPGNCILVKENVEDHIEGAEVVRGVPCFHFYVNGTFREDATITGADIDAVERMIKAILENI